MIVANSLIVSVMSRTPEIGLRRALGFSRRTIAAKFMTEGALLGLGGGLGGIGLGVLVSLTASALLGWTPRFPLWLMAAGPLLGALTGLAAAAYPALRAARVRPADAVRSD